MKRAFWIGGVVGLVMPLVLFFPDQILPSRLWYALTPGSFAGSTLYISLHRGNPAPLPIWEKSLCLIVVGAGNFLVYGLATYAYWRFRSRRSVAEG
ncbi:MAG TPA: hypothetical protein VGG45_03855 [Terracidiphilus sp.]|jgi:hypothetical protein